MNVRKYALILITVFLAGLQQVEAGVFDELGRRTIENAAGQEGLTVVLVPPPAESRNIDGAFLSWIEEQITNALAATRSSVTVLVRRELDVIARERDLQFSALYDTGSRAAFSQAVGANTFGFIDLVDWGDRYVVYLDLVRAATGELLSSERTVVRKTLLPSRYVDLRGVTLEQLGDPDLLFGAISNLASGPASAEPAGRRMALAEVRSFRAGNGLQRAAVKDLQVALFEHRAPGTRILLRDTEELLVSAITEELQTGADPGQLAGLAPQFWGAEVLTTLTIDVDPLRDVVEFGLRHIDAERGSYLPGAASNSLALHTVYRPLYLPPDFLEISSTPSGVAVRIDGQEYGRTPAVAFGLPAGEYTVELSGVEPYATTRRTVRIAPGGGRQQLDIAMEEPRVRLRVVDSETGRPISDPVIQSDQLFTRSGGVASFSGLQTGTDRVLRVQISKTGYLPGTEELTLHPGMESMTEWEVRLLPARERTITVLTEPEGAMVFIDNAFTGRTPITNQPLQVGSSSFPVRIQAPGWNTINRQVDLREIGPEGVLSVMLTRNVWLRSTPPGAQVTLNGEPAGRTDAQVALSAGPNTIEFKLGSFERVVTFDPVTDEAREVAVVVTRQRSDIPVNLVCNLSGVEVWVDNAPARFQGSQVLLPSGPQRIRIARSGYAPVVRYVNVRPGANIHAYLLSVEQQQQLQHLQDLVADEKFGQAEEDLVLLFEGNTDSPQVAIALLDLYILAMEKLEDRVLSNQREINRLAREFETVSRRVRIQDPEAGAQVQYLRARYGDALARTHRDTVEYYSQAVSAYSAFTELYRGGSGLYLDSDESRGRFEHAYYRRAVLAAQQFDRFYRGTSAEADQRAVTVAHQLAYIQLSLPGKSNEWVREVRESLAELQE